MNLNDGNETLVTSLNKRSMSQMSLAENDNKTEGNQTPVINTSSQMNSPAIHKKAMENSLISKIRSRNNSTSNHSVSSVNPSIVETVDSNSNLNAAVSTENSSPSSVRKFEPGQSNRFKSNLTALNSDSKNLEVTTSDLPVNSVDHDMTD